MFHPRGPTFSELMRQALSSTTDGYDLLAPKFDMTPFRTPDTLLAPMMEAVGPPGSVARGLDVCCGTGAATRALATRCRTSVTGVDLSEGMLAQARQHAQGSPIEHRYLQADALAMDFDQEFELVTSCGAFGHILPEDQDRFIARIFAALVPGGRFVFVTRVPPTPADRVWWAYRGFNAALKVRNLVLKPPFIMYYLIFTLPRALEVLTRQGFQVEVRDIFTAPYDAMRLVIATRPAAPPEHLH